MENPTHLIVDNVRVPVILKRRTRKQTLAPRFSTALMPSDEAKSPTPMEEGYLSEKKRVKPRRPQIKHKGSKLRGNSQTFSVGGKRRRIRPSKLESFCVEMPGTWADSDDELSYIWPAGSSYYSNGEGPITRGEYIPNKGFHIVKVGKRQRAAILAREPYVPLVRVENVSSKHDDFKIIQHSLLLKQKPGPRSKKFAQRPLPNTLKTGITKAFKAIVTPMDSRPISLTRTKSTPIIKGKRKRSENVAASSALQNKSAMEIRADPLNADPFQQPFFVAVNDESNDTEWVPVNINEKKALLNNIETSSYDPTSLDSKICRLCGIAGVQRFSLLGVKAEKLNLVYLLKKYLEIDIFSDEALPLHICPLCSQSVTAFHYFHLRTVAASNRLLAILKESGNVSQEQRWDTVPWYGDNLLATAKRSINLQYVKAAEVNKNDNDSGIPIIDLDKNDGNASGSKMNTNIEQIFGRTSTPKTYITPKNKTPKTKTQSKESKGKLGIEFGANLVRRVQNETPVKPNQPASVNVAGPSSSGQVMTKTAAASTSGGSTSNLGIKSPLETKCSPALQKERTHTNLLLPKPSPKATSSAVGDGSLAVGLKATPEKSPPAVDSSQHSSNPELAGRTLPDVTKEDAKPKDKYLYTYVVRYISTAVEPYYVLTAHPNKLKNITLTAKNLGIISKTVYKNEIEKNKRKLSSNFASIGSHCWSQHIIWFWSLGITTDIPKVVENPADYVLENKILFDGTNISKSKEICDQAVAKAQAQRLPPNKPLKPNSQTCLLQTALELNEKSTSPQNTSPKYTKIQYTNAPPGMSIPKLVSLTANRLQSVASLSKPSVSEAATKSPQFMLLSSKADGTAHPTISVVFQPQPSGGIITGGGDDVSTGGKTTVCASALSKITAMPADKAPTYLILKPAPINLATTVIQKKRPLLPRPAVTDGTTALKTAPVATTVAGSKSPQVVVSPVLSSSGIPIKQTADTMQKLLPKPPIITETKVEVEEVAMDPLATNAEEVEKTTVPKPESRTNELHVDAIYDMECVSDDDYDIRPKSTHTQDTDALEVKTEHVTTDLPLQANSPVPEQSHDNEVIIS